MFHLNAATKSSRRGVIDDALKGERRAGKQGVIKKCFTWTWQRNHPVGAWLMTPWKGSDGQASGAWSRKVSPERGSEIIP